MPLFLSHGPNSILSSEFSEIDRLVFVINDATNLTFEHTYRMDEGNRCVLWADAHTGAVMRCENQFLHNTKIGRSAYHEKKAHENSRQSKQPAGRYIGIPQMIHQIIGETDIHTNLQFVEVSTRPFEYRRSSNVRLDNKGKVRGSYEDDAGVPDAASPRTESCELRDVYTPSRKFTENQELLLQPNKTVSAYDNVTLFGLRPPEILRLFPKLRDYYRWFKIDDKKLCADEICKGLDSDITKCLWIDGIGRRIMLRRQTLGEAIESIDRRLSLDDKLSESDPDKLPKDIRELGRHLSEMSKGGKIDPTFVKDDRGEQIPTVVFSRVLPNRGTSFLLHMMLVLGEFDTELDLRGETLLDSLVNAKLIPKDAVGKDADYNQLYKAMMEVVKRVITEIIPLQPVSMSKLDEFIVKTKQLLQSAVFGNEIPMTDLPPSILTELLLGKNEAMEKEWADRRSDQLDSIYANLESVEGIPDKMSVMNATKSNPVVWENPDETFVRTPNQSEESHQEQQLALRLGINCVRSYSRQFSENMGYTKGLLVNGAPGAGKTFIEQAVGLYAMSQGLRVMSSSLMAVRSNAIGGYHLHRLFQLDVNNSSNLFRHAEVSLSCLYW